MGQTRLVARPICDAPPDCSCQWQTLRELGQELGLPATDTDMALLAMINGAMATLMDAGLPPAVMDLVPVKPLADVEPALLAAYRTALPALHAKIRPPERLGARVGV